MAGLYWVWLGCKLISTFYVIFWDIKMDFGFFAANDGGNRWLREELVYPSTNIYYTIAVQDVVLRFSWAVGILLNKVSQNILFSTSMPLQAKVGRKLVTLFF